MNEFTKDSLKYCFDCISEGDSPRISVAAMSSTGGVYSTLLPVPRDQVTNINPKVQMKHTLGYTVFGEYFTVRSREFPASLEDFEFGKMFWEFSKGLLEQGKVKVHKPSVNKYGKGLDGVLEGMQQMRNGKVSGEKLVYTIG
jgi:hypothetical protein